MLRLHDFLDRIAWALTHVALGICVFLFGFSTLMLTAEIVGRYVFNYPFQYIAETVTIGFIYIFMVGAAALYSRNEDIALDYFFARANSKIQAVWLLLIFLAIACTMSVTLVATVQLIRIQGDVLTPSLRIPLGVEHAALAIAAAMIAFTSLVDALGCLIWAVSGRRPARRIAGPGIPA